MGWAPPEVATRRPPPGDRFGCRVDRVDRTIEGARRAVPRDPGPMRCRAGAVAGRSDASCDRRSAGIAVRHRRRRSSRWRAQWLPAAGPARGRGAGSHALQLRLAGPPGATADDLLADVYHLGQHPAVTLPHDLTWREDPLRRPAVAPEVPDAALRDGAHVPWQATDDGTYRDRGIELVRSWIAANPYRVGRVPVRLEGPGHRVAGDDPGVHRGDAAAEATGWTRPSPTTAPCWRIPTFYVVGGNHALNQSIGLLDVGCYVGRTDWQQLAVPAHRPLHRARHRQPGRARTSRPSNTTAMTTTD